MGKLDKQALKYFVEFECDRQLFWAVGREDARWMSAPRHPEERHRERPVSDMSMEMGKRYEQRVYRFLRQLPGTHAELDPHQEVIPTPLDRALMEEYADALRPGQPLCLLEHQWPMTPALMSLLFGQTLEQEDQYPVQGWTRQIRPDLLLLSPPGQGPEVELLPDGSRRALSAQERAGRVALSLIDIKHTNPHAVGKRHFIELIFYAHALSAWVHQEGLQGRFYVPLAGHAILPQLPQDALFFTSLEALRALCVPMAWQEAVHIFHYALERLQGLHRAAPLQVDEVAVHIHPACGRCDYLEDCKRSLGVRDGSAPAQWDLRLLAYAGQAVAEQLRQEGFRTVGDVQRRLAQLPMDDTPAPLYAERPLLALKADALVARRLTFPNPQGEAGQRHLSMALPQYCNLSLVFDVEADPTHDLVFGFGLDLWGAVSAQSPLAPRFEAWWGAWARARRLSPAAERVSPSLIWPALDIALLEQRYGANQTREQLRAQVDELLAQFARSLWFLCEQTDGVDLCGPGEPFRGQPGAQPRFGFRYAYVNMGLELEHEAHLARKLLQVLYHTLRLCNVMEALVLAPAPGSGSGTIQLSMGGFYWSSEQLQHAQDLLERHLPSLLALPEARAQLEALIAWLTPSQSGVAHAYRHKKIFNLRGFVESCAGLPHIINYTWHEICVADKILEIDHRFWPPHFNYMDFSTWHDYLQEPDTARKAARAEALRQQLLLKVYGLTRLRQSYQRRAREQGLLSRASRNPHDQQALARQQPDPGFHPLARFWSLYARLHSALQELGAESARLDFPTRSVGKLRAAQVQLLGLRARPDGKGALTALTCGVSTHMSLREGDRLLLLPEASRDELGHDLGRWKVSLEQLTWDPVARTYQLALLTEKPQEHPWHGLSAAQRAGLWFLYPESSDVWPGRLFLNKNALLRRHNLGQSWLGQRLAFLWGVGGLAEVPPPPAEPLHLPEVYLYAPSLLPAALPLALPEGPLLRPDPDDSQREAILMALSRPLSCIQGPPGTGKSQTIAALVETFLRTHPGPRRRVLISAFSYAAMRVVLDKLRQSAGPDGAPAQVARAQLVFTRSASREPIPCAPGLRDVDDLVLSSNSMTLNGQTLNRRGGRRLEDYLEGDFILFANAHALYNLGTPSESARQQYELLGNDFAFDLIVVDEASQMPTDHFLGAVALVQDQPVTLRPSRPLPDGPLRSPRALNSFALDGLDPARLSRVVIVGDHNQLPPVQEVKPPERLQMALGSLFQFYLQGHQVPHHQLRVNYRSRPPIVSYTDSLGLYEPLTAWRGDHPLPALPAPPPQLDPWVRQILADDFVVGALLHDNQFETSISPLEAHLIAALVEGFFLQLDPQGEQAQRHFWAEEVGIVAPHNAQGRLITRAIFDRLSPRSALSPDELMSCLRQTIYSVERFQGSDRTFILGSVGVSSRDQLAAEEDFLYDLNRFNVLTSRARQKILLLCSRNFLRYIPRHRVVMGHAALIRDFAEVFCDQHAPLHTSDHNGDPLDLTLRWRG